MRSHLTRHVFRRILYSETHTLYQCPYRPITKSRGHGAQLLCLASRRSLFGFPSRRDRKQKKVDLDPGLGTMLKFNSNLRLRARPPPAEELVAAFNAFFKSKMNTKETLEEVQAGHVLQTFRHLQQTNQEQEGFGFTLKDLRIARDTLVNVPEEKPSTHEALARAFYEEIQRRKDAMGSDVQPSGPEDLLPFVTVLCQTGSTKEALSLAEEYWKSHPDSGRTSRRLAAKVLSGFAREKNEEELLRTTISMEENGVDFDAGIHQVITKHYALLNDIEATKKWYGHPIANDEVPTPYTSALILRFCIRNNEMGWGSSVFKSILESNPSKETWDVIFQWAAARGKGVDEVDRMMQVMVRRNPDDHTLRPDIETINGLVEFANSRNDPYTAERYVGLGHRWNMIPNANTYILQMEYRIKVGDIDGANAAYEMLQGQAIKDNEDLPVVFKLIQALCAVKYVNFDRLMSIVTDLKERKVRLDPGTVAALSLLHLQREEYEEVMDLLNSHTFHYGLEQRARIRDAFLAFCLDPQNSTARVWDAHEIFHSVFEETPREIRTQMMNEFFRRRRTDMACLVFQNMRQHTIPEHRPTVDTYIACFQGLASVKDVEGLEMTHNMLKVDFEIEPSTRLYNALMLAYTACDLPYRSLEFWDDITNSREGPTYQTIEIVFQACEAAPYGDKRAREIWQKLKKMGVERTKGVYSTYIGALAGHNHFEEVRKVVEEMEEAGFNMDSLILGTIYNAIKGDTKKYSVAKWAEHNYPEAWEELVKVGQHTSEEGWNFFNIDRSVKP